MTKPPENDEDEDSAMVADDCSEDTEHAKGDSYSYSEESYEDYHESPEKSYSDTDSGESFENDYESPEYDCPSQPLPDAVSYSDEEYFSDGEEGAVVDDTALRLSYTDSADSSEDESDVGHHSCSPSSRSKIKQLSNEEPLECQPGRRKDEVKSGISAEACSEKAAPQVENVIRNQRRKVRWADPKSLNWSFHEGFEDNASHKRRQLKRWNSSDDLVASSGKRRGGRRDRGSSRDSSERSQDNPVRDPPGHHIESPSVKTKIFSLKLVQKSNEETSTALHARLPVVVEDDVGKVDDSEHELGGSAEKPNQTASLDNLTRGPVLPSGEISRIHGPRESKSCPSSMPVRRISSDKVIPLNRQSAPLRRTKSSDGAASATSKEIPRSIPLSSQASGAGSIQTSNSSSGSSEGSRNRAAATARRILMCNKSEDRLETNSEWQSFEKRNWVSEGKENPRLNISNVTSRLKMPATKRAPGQLSASLHYVGPRPDGVAIESSKFQSQSMHVHSGSKANGLIHGQLPEKDIRGSSTRNGMDADESIRSTEVSSDSPSFALQISQSSFSSFQSEESSAAKDHKNRAATSSVMSSATLTLTISQARGLISLERNIFGKMKPPEPIVELYLGGKPCGKTGVARRSSNPVWKESEIVCEIGGDMARELSRKSEKLELRIYDRNNKKENFMGAIMFALPKDDAASWYSVTARSEQAGDFYCPGATGSLEVKVQIMAKFYPALAPEHVFVLRQHSKIALDLSWTQGSSLETCCVATDLQDGLVLWEESVYFANRTNPNRSIVFPERLEMPGHPIIDTLVLDLDNIPKKVGSLCLVLTARENSLSDLKSFDVRCKDALTGQGIGRFVPRLNTSDTSVVLLRMSRAESKKTWDLEVMAKGYRGFREFGSMLPEIQAIAQGTAASISRPAERTALMRAGDSIRIQDYVATLPEKLSVGLFWKVANGENVLPVALLLDKDSHLLDIIHRQNTQSKDLSVAYAEDKFEVSLNETAADIHYICFSLGPYLGEQADHILTAAFNILNTTDGTELLRSTIPDFDRFPTRTVTIGCFYRGVDSWDFALLGIPSSDLTLDDCTRTIQHYLIEKPLEPPSPLILKA